MKWKEFFKPTPLKIILTLILSIIFVPAAKYQLICITAPCGYGLKTLSGYLMDMANNGSIIKYVVGIDYLMLFFGAFLSYVISCAVSTGAKKVLNK